MSLFEIILPMGVDITSQIGYNSIINNKEINDDQRDFRMFGSYGTFGNNGCFDDGAVILIIILNMKINENKA